MTFNNSPLKVWTFTGSTLRVGPVDLRMLSTHGLSTRRIADEIHLILGILDQHLEDWLTKEVPEAMKLSRD